MRRRDIDRFFLEASKKITHKVSIYITGGVAAWFMGGKRPTEDIDFGLKTKKWSETEALFQEISAKMRLPIQFSENISRWSMIEIPNYEKNATHYKSFGSISVFFLDPISWSIGKISRYYRSDVDDLRVVFKKQKPKIEKIINAWKEALKKSPKSSEQFSFLKTAEDFLKSHGTEIWGKSFEAQKWIEQLNNKS